LVLFDQIFVGDNFIEFGRILFGVNSVEFNPISYEVDPIEFQSGPTLPNWTKFDRFSPG